MSSVMSMFESMKESLSAPKGTGGGFSGNNNVMRLKAGNTYLVRIIPNVKAPEKTFFHANQHGWTSTSTGRFVACTCPSTYGERCPLCEERFKLYERNKKTGSARDKELAALLRKSEKHYCNVYVVDDPVTPENNGTTKILRFAEQIKTKFDAAISGDDASEFGARVFDLSDKGCNFKIKVETTTGEKGKDDKAFTSYSNSRFCGASAIPNMTAARIDEVHASIHDLEVMAVKPTQEQMDTLIRQHIYTGAATQTTTSPSDTKSRGEDDLDYSSKPAPTVATNVAKTGTPPVSDKVRDLLKGLKG